MAKSSNKLFGTKFRNWLLYLVVSRQNLKAVAGYTIQALRQDGKQFQPQLDLLQPLYDGFDASLTSSAGASAGRGSQTLLADTVFGLVKQFMKRAYKLHFAALEETNPALYKEFFPAGRSEFSDATRKSLGTNQAAVPGGAALLTDARTLAGQHTAARTTQDERKKQVRTASTTLATDETDLLVELFGALLAFHYRTPEKVADYFDFSMLARRAPGPDEATQA